MMQNALGKVLKGKELSQQEAYEAVRAMLSGKIPAVQMAAFLTAMRVKGASISELVGAARAIKEGLVSWVGLENGFLSMDREEIHLDQETVERTSHGPEGGTATFNVSSAAAIVAAGAGVKVVRHASLVPSERVGTEHVLRHLGIRPEITPSLARRCLEETGVAFLYSPALHPASRLLYQVRRQLGFRTLLNVAGPLSNPCEAKAIYLGAYDAEDILKFPKVAKALGIRRGIIVHGDHTLDEASITGLTRTCELNEAGFQVKEFFPEDVGLSRAKPEEILGGDAERNATVIRKVLEGERGPRRDLVLLNAGLALLAAGRAQDLKSAMEMAQESIDSAEALGRLNCLARLTNETGYVRCAE